MARNPEPGKTEDLNFHRHASPPHTTPVPSTISKRPSPAVPARFFPPFLHHTLRKRPEELRASLRESPLASPPACRTSRRHCLTAAPSPARRREGSARAPCAAPLPSGPSLPGPARGRPPAARAGSGGGRRDAAPLPVSILRWRQRAGGRGGAAGGGAQPGRARSGYRPVPSPFLLCGCGRNRRRPGRPAGGGRWGCLRWPCVSSRRCGYGGGGRGVCLCLCDVLSRPSLRLFPPPRPVPPPPPCLRCERQPARGWAPPPSAASSSPAGEPARNARRFERLRLPGESRGAGPAAPANGMDQSVVDHPVTLIIKAPNQKYTDQTINCFLDWTVGKLKSHLSNVYPSKPVSCWPALSLHLVGKTGVAVTCGQSVKTSLRYSAK